MLLWYSLAQYILIELFTRWDNNLERLMQLSGKQYAMNKITALMSAESESKTKISELFSKYTIGNMLEYFTVGTERQKMMAPKRPDPNMLTPIRKLERQSLLLQEKSKGMGDIKGKHNKGISGQSDIVIKTFIPDWFGIWISLVNLPEFDVNNYDIIGLTLSKIRVLPKYQEKGIQYIERICRNSKYQWAIDFGILYHQTYDDRFKRKKKHMTPNAVATLLERQKLENNSSVKINKDTKDKTLLKNQVIRRGDRRWRYFPGCTTTDKINEVKLTQVKCVTTRTIPDEQIGRMESVRNHKYKKVLRYWTLE